MCRHNYMAHIYRAKILVEPPAPHCTPNSKIQPGTQQFVYTDYYNIKYDLTIASVTLPVSVDPTNAPLFDMTQVNPER